MTELNIWGISKQLNQFKKANSSVATAKLGEMTPERKITTFEK